VFARTSSGQEEYNGGNTVAWNWPVVLFALFLLCVSVCVEQEAAAALGRGLLKSALAAMRGAGRERSALILSRELGAMYCADGRHAEACALLTRQCGGSACEQLTGWPLLRYAQRRRRHHDDNVFEKWSTISHRLLSIGSICS
jgi:hypothetical protein